MCGRREPDAVVWSDLNQFEISIDTYSSEMNMFWILTQHLANHSFGIDTTHNSTF